MTDDAALAAFGAAKVGLVTLGRRLAIHKVPRDIVTLGDAEFAATDFLSFLQKGPVLVTETPAAVLALAGHCRFASKETSFYLAGPGGHSRHNRIIYQQAASRFRRKRSKTGSIAAEIRGGRSRFKAVFGRG